MRKGHAPFVFSACAVACWAFACGGDDSAISQVGGAGAGGSAGGGSVEAGVEGGKGGTPRFDGGGIPVFDVQVQRDPNCPTAMPMDNDACGMAATCAYPTGGCTCQRERGSDGGRTWHCQEFPQWDGGAMMCPFDTMNGEQCETSGRFCNNGMQTCVCLSSGPGDRKWSCF